MWLFVGACFGLGYGVTQRLMRVNVSGGWQGSQLFGVKPFPGTGLAGLRERFGAEKMEIRGDLDLLELERQKQEEQKEISRREAEIKRREAEDQERRQREAERIRLELLPRYPNVDGVVALEHSYGYGVAIEAPGADIPIRTLRHIALNPNFGGEVLMISLGCEKLQPERLMPAGLRVVPIAVDGPEATKSPNAAQEPKSPNAAH